MDEQLQEDWLEARFREEAPYIDDAGFTAQIVQKLPTRRAARHSFRGIILLCLTLLASTLTYVASGGGRFVETMFNSVADTLRLVSALPFWLTAVVVVCGLAIATVVAVGAALAQTREIR